MVGIPRWQKSTARLPAQAITLDAYGAELVGHRRWRPPSEAHCASTRQTLALTSIGAPVAACLNPLHVGGSERANPRPKLAISKQRRWKLQLLLLLQEEGDCLSSDLASQRQHVPSHGSPLHVAIYFEASVRGSSLYISVVARSQTLQPMKR
jgi:hypothetical protein